jgi:hypothetical protein
MEMFSENSYNNSSEIIIEKIRNGEWNYILKNMCYIKDNELILDFIYFKHFATIQTYDFIINFITNSIDSILINKNNFIVHVNMKKLTLVDIDKHKIFIQSISEYLKEKYPQKLEKCYIYNSPFIFSQVYNLVSMFIDKETQKKISLVNN